MKPPAIADSLPDGAPNTSHMRRALELAERAVGLASPNPPVGAVLVRDGRIVGEGFHVYDKLKHAEVVAIEAAGDSARGSTLYVTLEPCCHTGRTGPCTKAIINAGVAQVFAAMADPNPEVAGRGFAELRAAGVEVFTGLGEDDARKLNEPFANWILSRRPLVTLKCALTLDGQLTLPHLRSRRPPLQDRWISSPESRAEVQRLRHASDALLTGIGTILADDPLLTDRTNRPRRRKLLRVVMDSRLRLPLRSQLVRSADGDLLVLTRAGNDSPKAKALRRAGVEVIRVPGRGIRPDLRALIDELGRREILSVLLEAGTTLNSAALAAGIVDKMQMFIAPKVSGIRTRTAGMVPGLQSALQVHNTTMARFGVDYAIEGYLRDVYRAR